MMGLGRQGLLAQIFSFLAVILLSCAMARPALAQEHTLNFRGADIQAFIDDVSLVTGYAFIVDPDVSGEVTITSQTSLTSEEVFQVFLSTLRAQGYAAVRIGPGRYRIVPEAEGARAGVTTGDTRDGDVFMTSVFRLRNISARDAARTAGPLVSTSGTINASDASNLVVIVDFASNIASIVDVLRNIDRDTSVTQLVELENISADELSRVLERLRNSATTGEDDRRFAVTVASVPSSNAVLLRGEAGAVAEMVALAREVDEVSESNQTFRVIYLDHADGQSLVPLLEQIATALSPGGGAGAGQRGTSIGFHSPTNSIVINAEPDLLRELEQVIERLDIRRPQVLIEAIIVEISDTAARDLGVQYVLTGNGEDATPFSYTRFGGNQVDLLALTGAIASPNGLFGEDDSTANQFNFQQLAISSLLGTRGGTLGVGGQQGDTLFGLILNALETDTDSNILSKPEIMVLDNEEASLVVGQEIPITTGEALGANNANPFRTINREEVGVKLDVTPQINEGDTVRLVISQEVSGVAGPVTAISTELVTNIRQLSTTVLADDGEIIVLGGLISQDDQVLNDQVPGLGSIPALGRLFRSETTTRQRQNLMVFIRPTIVRSAEDMRGLAQQNYNFIVDEQRRASRNGASSLEDIVGMMMQGRDPFRDSQPAGDASGGP